MCGIAGFLLYPGHHATQETADLMTDRVSHRGPDARGVYFDAAAGVALGHRRLSIVDVSNTGAQPMTSVSGRYVISLNGEIYNFRALRQELEHAGVGPWRGTSDTEVLVNAIDTWGIDKALSRIEGMFAFALWDKNTCELILARDRFGEKPLIVAKVRTGWLFASELSAISSHPAFDARGDNDAIDQFLTLSYIPEPQTPFIDTWKLPPGSFVRLRQTDRSLTPQYFWKAIDAAFAARRAQREAPWSAEDLQLSIENRLSEVVRNQMVADVPLGAFLSGGIDSSVIAALMQQSSARPIKTFTIGFEDTIYDEAPFARAVAKHLGTEHHEIMVTWQDAIDLVERLPSICDEPFADSSQLPTYLVSAGARRHVTVALTGDAGDEIFGGYNRHQAAMKYDRLSQLIPASGRRIAGHALAQVANLRTIELVERSLGVISPKKRIRLLGEKASKLSGLLRSPGGLEAYLGLVRRDEGLLSGESILESFRHHYAHIQLDEPCTAESMMLLDTITYLPGDILTKVDRASMSVALETRAPYLDHKLFELAWRSPITERITNGKTKNNLRKLLTKYVPAALFERPKMGFGVPINSWLRGALKDWMRDNLEAFKQSYPQHTGLADNALALYLRGSPTAHHLLWNIAMLQSWTSQSGKRGPASVNGKARTGTQGI